MKENQNAVSAELTAESVETIIGYLKSIEASIPFAVTLTSDEKVSLPKLGPKEFDFCVKAHHFAEKNPELQPQYLDMIEFGKDIKLGENLHKILYHLVPVTAKLMDTYMLTKTEAYYSARLFYHFTKAAAKGNVPGASAVATELGKLYKNPKSKSTTDSAEPQLETPEA